MNIEIAKASKNHSAKSIAELFNTVFLVEDFMATDDPISVETISKIIDSSLTGIYLAIEKEQNKYVGFIYVQRKKSPEFAHQLRIQAIGIESVLRGKGIGKKLMTYLFDTAKSQGIELITLEVVAENNNAIGLYESMGMKLTGSIPGGFIKNAKKYDVLTYYIAI